MSHVRTQIRQAAATALGSVAPVSVSRVYPIGDGELPILLVYTNDEEIVGATQDAYSRTVDLAVDVVAKGPAVDDDIDALLVGVEKALNRSKLGGLCKPMFPVSIAITIETGATAIGRARIVYRAQYFTAQADPETAL